MEAPDNPKRDAPRDGHRRADPSARRPREAKAAPKVLRSRARSTGLQRSREMTRVCLPELTQLV
jgi:hypothetical protein